MLNRAHFDGPAAWQPADRQRNFWHASAQMIFELKILILLIYKTFPDGQPYIRVHSYIHTFVVGQSQPTSGTEAHLSTQHGVRLLSCHFQAILMQSETNTYLHTHMYIYMS